METQRMLELIRPSVKEGNITLDKAWTMLQKMNVPLSYVHVESLFKTVENKCLHATNKSGIVTIYQSLLLRDEFREIFERHSENGEFLTVEELLKFLRIEQQEESTRRCDAIALIKKYEPTKHGKQKQMTLEGFSRMMVSDDLLLFKREHTKVYQDMTLPMCNYLISSSHNTYLMADQLVGPSHVWAYGSALLKGCRCVEIDCWDGADGEPIVTHGHTLTSKISFKDVLVAIKENAFKASQYPVILSLENHCSPDQKLRMVHHLTSVFQDMLVSEPLTHGEEHELPSPQKLMNKILIKDKLCYSEKSSVSGESDEEVCEMPEREEEEEEGGQCELPMPPTYVRHSLANLKAFDNWADTAAKKKKEKNLKKEDALSGDDGPIPAKKLKTSLTNLKLVEGLSRNLAGKMAKKNKKKKAGKDKMSNMPMTAEASETEDDEGQEMLKSGFDRNVDKDETDRKRKKRKKENEGKDRMSKMHMAAETSETEDDEAHELPKSGLDRNADNNKPDRKRKKKKKENEGKDKMSNMHMVAEASETEDDEAHQLPKSGLDRNVGKDEKVREKKVARKKIMLSSMVIYTKATRFSSFASSREVQKFDEMNSMEERKALRFATLSANEFIYHTSRFLTRIYPKGVRTDSSNYNPLPYWSVGCQMVALNFQTPGLPMDLQNAKFLDNGGCGFVLKPEFLRVKEFEPSSEAACERPTVVAITIISANQLRRKRGQYDKADPFVSVEIHEKSETFASKQTKVVKNNALNPRWNETLTFSVHERELALVRFRVSNQVGMRPEFIGQYTLPLLSMMKGYRTVPLYMKNGAILEASTLFVYVYYN